MISWQFNGGTVCIDSDFLGISSRQCEPTWLWWVSLVIFVASLVLIVYNTIKLVVVRRERPR